MLTRYPVPREKVIPVMDYCFKMLTTFQPAAVKVHAMDILHKLNRRMPEIWNEIVSTIEMAIPEGTTGVKNRGEKVLKKLKADQNDINNHF